MLFKAVQDKSPGLCIVIGIHIENDNHSQMYCQGGGNWLRTFKPCGGGGFFCLLRFENPPWVWVTGRGY